MVGIITASMMSKRFPRKMLSQVYGMTLIEYIICRARELPVDRIILGVTYLEEDDVLAEIGRVWGLELDRGQPKNQVSQFIRCDDDYALRLYGDSPCINSELIARGMFFMDPDGMYDVITNICTRTFPLGVSLEIIKLEALRRAYPYMTAQDKEFITSYFYRNKEQFNIKEIFNGKDESDLRLTVDYPEDLGRISEHLLCSPQRV